MCICTDRFSLDLHKLLPATLDAVKGQLLPKYSEAIFKINKMVVKPPRFKTERYKKKKEKQVRRRKPYAYSLQKNRSSSAWVTESPCSETTENDAKRSWLYTGVGGSRKPAQYLRVRAKEEAPSARTHPSSSQAAQSRPRQDA